jgi:hypothetical protein
VHGFYTRVVQHIGYDLYTRKVSTFQPMFLKNNIGLKPRTLEGKRVEVVAEKPRLWKKRMKIFKRQFL